MTRSKDNWSRLYGAFKPNEKSVNVLELTKNLVCFGASMFGGTIGERLAGALLKEEIMGLERVDVTATQKAIDNRNAKLTGRLTGEMVKELRYVRKNKRPSGNLISDQLLHGLLIVAYRNGSAWFDAHPMVWDELKGGSL